MEDTISLKNVFAVLKRHLKLILCCTLFTALITGLAVNFLITPVYQATTQILVNQKGSENQLDVNQIRNNIDLINTYSEIIKSPVILEKVKENNNLKQSVSELSQEITINNQENSQVFSLTVQDSSPTSAVKIANAVSNTFQKEVKDIMDTDNVSILADAEIKNSSTPIKPNVLLTTLIAMIVGLMIGVAISLVIDYMDSTIKNEKDIEELLKTPILGAIAEMPKKLKNG